MPLHIKRRGLMMVVSSPSGAGKTTLCQRLLANDAELLMSISTTTRPMRETEIDGKDYFFVDKERFHVMAERGEFLEHASVFGHYYATPRSFVEQRIRDGQDTLFDIDWQGAQQLTQNMASDVVKIFILPPSIAELRRRLDTRALDSPEVVAHRMTNAASEISHWAEYDYVIVNIDITSSVDRLRSILIAERQRRERLSGLDRLAAQLCGTEQS